MALALDTITHKRILLVRTIFSRGESLIKSAHNYADKIIGLISLDLATETILKAILADEKPERHEANFHRLIERVDLLMVAENLPLCPDVANIKQVHDIRNGAQHRAICPIHDVLHDCRTYTGDFLKKIVRNVWDAEFEKLSMIDLIGDAAQGRTLQTASTEIEKGDFTESCFQSKIAFERMLGLARPLVGRDTSVFHPSDPWSDRKEFAQMNAIVGDLNNFRILLLQLVLGIDRLEYKKYRSITSRLCVSSFGGDKYGKTISRGPCTEEEATFTLDFVINSIVNSQGIAAATDE